MAKEIVAMILAGGRGSRLYALTQKTANNEKEHAKMWFKELAGIGEE